MSHGLFPELVSLTEDHRYIDEDGKHFLGFTTFFENCLHKPFNSSAAAYGVAKSKIGNGEPTSADAVLKQWEEKRDLGVRYDEAIQLYLLNQTVKPENEDIAECVKSVCEEYAGYYKTFTQLCLYNQSYKIAGSPDITGLTANRKDSPFEMGDNKVFEKDDLHKHDGWFKGPLAHLSATKFNKIALQLSFYAWQFETLTGRKCKKLFIHQIHHETRSHKKVFVNYLKNDILLALEYFKDNLVTLSEFRESQNSHIPQF